MTLLLMLRNTKKQQKCKTGENKRCTLFYRKILRYLSNYMVRISEALMLELFFNSNYRPLAKFVAMLRIYLATSKKKEGAYSALQSAPGLNGTPCGCVTAPFVRRLTVACSHHRHH